MRSALRTKAYQPLLAAVGLGSGREIAAAGPDLMALLPVARFPKPGPPPSAVSNADAPPPPPADLFWPVPPPSRTAVLMEGFREGWRTRFFGPQDFGRLRKYAPDALAGPVSALRTLAERIPSRICWNPKLRHSLMAMLVFPQTGVTAETRELLWRVFEVPLYAQILSPSRNLLAWECQAHAGYHVAEQNAVFELVPGLVEPELVVTSLVDLRDPVLRLATGLTATIERSRCGCGFQSPRLVDLRVCKQAAAKAMAASAACAAD
ncbi:MAG: hypothetical protein ACUVXB_08785 [Bryobacteraceae bacterium]